MIACDTHLECGVVGRDEEGQTPRALLGATHRAEGQAVVQDFVTRGNRVLGEGGAVGAVAHPQVERGVPRAGRAERLAPLGVVGGVEPAR